MSRHNDKDGTGHDDGDDLGRVYRALEQPGSPPDVDAAIRAAAHEALESPHEKDSPGAQRRWYRMAGLAAVVVLSASVVVLMPRYEDPPPARRTLPPASVAPDSPAESEPVPARESNEKKRDDKRSNDARVEQVSEKLKRERAVGKALQTPADAPPLGAESAAMGSQTDRPSLQQMQPELAEEALDADTGFDYRAAPELWIAHIERLLAAGRFEDAEHEFQAFRAAFPQHDYAQSR